jgi:hypothetical protein
MLSNKYIKNKTIKIWGATHRPNFAGEDNRVQPRPLWCSPLSLLSHFHSHRHTHWQQRKKILYCPVLSPLSLTVTKQFLSHRNYFFVSLSQCGFSFAQLQCDFLYFSVFSLTEYSVIFFFSFIQLKFSFKLYW